jgi:hypothetical protein
MGGFRIGDAMVSQEHHNFIVNAGKAKARDYLAVMKEIYKRAKNELDVELIPEIFLLGFKDSQIRQFNVPRNIELRKKDSYQIKPFSNNSKR